MKDIYLRKFDENNNALYDYHNYSLSNVYTHTLTNNNYGIIATDYVCTTKFDSNGNNTISKQYYSIKTKTQYNKIIDTFNNVYQILCNPNILLTFDIDDVSILEKDLENVIHTFLDQLNNIMNSNIKLSIDDIFVNVKTKPKINSNQKIIDSIHIHSNKYSITKEDNKSLCKYYNDLEDKLFDLDYRIYGSNQLICNLGSGKLQLNNQSPIYKVYRTFTYSKINRIPYEEVKYLRIDETNNNHIELKIVPYSFHNANKKKSIKKNVIYTEKSIIEYLYENCKNELKKSSIWKRICYIVKRDNIDTIENFCLKSIGNSKYTYKDNVKYYKDGILFDDKYKYSGSLNEYCIEYLNMEIIENPITNDLIEYIGKKFPHLNKKLDKIETLMKTTFYNRVKKDKENQKIIENNKNQNIILNDLNDSENDSQSNSENEEIFELETPNKLRKIKIYNATIYDETNTKYVISYDYERGIVFDNVNKDCFPYVFDRLLEKKCNDDVDKMINYNQDEFDKLINTIIYSSQKLFNIQALWGAGKSHHIIRHIINHYINLNCNILMITENNSLNKELKTKWGFTTHLDTNKYQNRQKYICSIESIHNLKNIDFHYDLIVIDEVVAFCNHFVSTTIKGNPKDNFQLIFDLIKKSSKVITADADLSTTIFSDIFKNINDDKPYEISHLEVNPYEDTIFNIYEKKKDLFDEIFQSLEENKRICILSSKRVEIEDVILKNIQYKYPNKKVCMITMNRVVEYINGYKFEQSNKVKNDLTKYLIEGKFDVLLYSPSITTGVSLELHKVCSECYSNDNNQKFCECNMYHKVFGIFNQCGENGITTITFLQMLFRIRRLIDKEINIWCGTFNRVVKEFNIEDIDYNLKNKLSIVMNSNTMIKDNIKYNKEIDDLFWKLRLHIDYNRLVSSNNSMYRIYENLINKKLNVVFHYDSRNRVEIIKEEDETFLNIDFLDSEKWNNQVLIDIFQRTERGVNSKPLTNEEQQFYNKFTLLGNGGFEFYNLKNENAKRMLYGYFDLDFVMNNWFLINKPYVLKYLKRNKKTFENSNKYKYGKTITNKLECDKKVDEFFVIDNSRKYYVEYLFNKFNKLYESQVGLTRVNYKLEDEEFNNLKCFFPSLTKSKNQSDILKSLTKIFSSNIGITFRIKKKQNKYIRETIPLFYKKPNYLDLDLIHRLDYSKNIVDNKFRGSVNSMVLQNCFKEDIEFKRSGNVIINDGKKHNLVIKYDKNSGRNDNKIFDKDNKIGDIHKYKEYKLNNDIMKKIRSLATRKSKIEKISKAKLINDNKKIRFQITHCINEKFFTQNTFYVLDNIYDLTSKEVGELNNNYKDVNKMFMKMKCECDTGYEDIKVNKDINKKDFVIDMLKIKHKKIDETYTYQLEDDDISGLELFKNRTKTLERKQQKKSRSKLNQNENENKNQNKKNSSINENANIILNYL